MNQYQFLKQLENIPTPGGDGVRLTKHLNIIADIRTAAGLVLDGSTTAPQVKAVETNGLAVQAAASTTACGTFLFTVPKDYDSLKDELKLNILAVSGGTTDAPTLTATAYKKTAGASLSAALTVVASAAIPSSTAKAAERTIDLSGNGLVAGDALTINLVASAHTTDVVNILSVEVQYRSGIVFETVSNRF